MTFSYLSPQQENQLYTLDKHDEGEETEGFQVAGKRITPQLLTEAMRTLPKEKRITILLYYFFNKSDVAIAERLKIPRSTVQYRRTSSFRQLKGIMSYQTATENEDTSPKNQFTARYLRKGLKTNNAMKIE